MGWKPAIPLCASPRRHSARCAPSPISMREGKGYTSSGRCSSSWLRRYSMARVTSASTPSRLCRFGVKTTTSFFGSKVVQMPALSVRPVRESTST
ncbi:hypothetical protein D3C72_1680950 [compost metagenome]